MNNSISIVIPLYNNEKHIYSCIDALKKQTDKNFEVIFVDDGSTDKTVEKLSFCLKEDIKFDYKILQQKNEGAAQARKTGIDSTSSQYIMIYDCDDIISKDFIKEFFRIIRNNDEVDIVMPNVKIQNEKMEFVDFKFYSDSIHLSSEECLLNSLDGWKIHGWFICKKEVFLKSYMEYKKINSKNNNYINNDEVITRLNVINSKNIVRNEAVYYYCYNENSATKSINSNRCLMIKNAFIMDEIFSNKIEFQAKVKAELVAVIWGNFIYMHKHKLQLQNLVVWKRVIRDAVDRLDYLNLMSKFGFKKKIQLTILKLIHIF
ncbi:glycosyltransferase family A protein [Acinetobacter sp. ANC 5378]|uniref:glycosyltransferase family A protein n=1 Tax=Acinetobacter sp. ANC 5378 TaxID=2731249 RepID=UPI00149002D4|nr:glycosyltransferase family A protein [Acinetobacter sp. ANC 5378]NNG81650.1 glycosyltransferase family 2 protein [Acinetobacter sp. ANC 5378]